MAINEEVKNVDSLFKIQKPKTCMIRSSKSNKKDGRGRKLDIQHKVREPLSVRKFDKNTEALNSDMESSRNGIYQFSTLPNNYIGSESLIDQPLLEEKPKMCNANSTSFL